MKRSIQTIVFLLSGFSALTSAFGTAFAQYIFIDTNGDGFHTDTDVVSPTGSTTLDVWIRTDANRDGSTVLCTSGDEPMSIVDYEFVLHAIDGTVSWDSFTNNLPNSPPNGQVSNGTDFVSGFESVNDTTPGLHRLATVSVHVLTGTPSILVVPISPLEPARMTGFGTACDGPRLDNTLTLGTDWFDTDGAPYGGWTNPPHLNQPATMTVAEDDIAEQELSATDPDGSTITISKAEGPNYMTVIPSGSGAATVRLNPGFLDSGSAMGIVAASDGVGKDIRMFGIRVLNTNRAPKILVTQNLCFEQGETKTFWITGIDPDYDQVSLSVDGLPPFVEILDSFPGYMRLNVTVPADQDTGVVAIGIDATDGRVTVHHDAQLRFTELGGCSGRAPLVARPTPNPMRGSGSLVFWTSVRGPLRVTLYDHGGKLVRTLLDESGAAEGYHRVPIPIEWFNSSRLASGIYFYKIEAKDGSKSGRFTVLR